MIPAPGETPRDVLKIWNSSVMNNGRINDGKSDADTGSVVPGILQVMDLPDFAQILRNRPLLYSAARNVGDQASTYRSAWQANSSKGNRNWFVPERPFSAVLLIEWLSHP
jgi:hypothetical protein